MHATIYSTPNCGYCTLMQQFLEEQQITYTTILIEGSEITQYLMQQTGRLGAPQTNIEGYWILGYNPHDAMKIINDLRS